MFGSDQNFSAGSYFRCVTRMPKLAVPPLCIDAPLTAKGSSEYTYSSVRSEKTMAEYTSGVKEPENTGHPPSCFSLP